jgi:hypothetical protein
VRHARRHPKHAVAGGVVLVALATGRPTVIVTAATVGAMIALVRRRPGALNPPRPPRAPHMPNALRTSSARGRIAGVSRARQGQRMPSPPQWPR